MPAPTVDIQPNTNGLPGLAALERIAGAILTFGLVAAALVRDHAALTGCTASEHRSPPARGAAATVPGPANDRDVPPTSR